MRSNTYLFVGISALLHVIVFAALSDSDNVFDTKEQGRSSLSVIITPANNIFKSNKLSENAEKTKTDNDKTLTKSKPLSSQRKSTAILNKEKNTTTQSVAQTAQTKTPINKPNNPKIKSSAINNQKIESIIKTELSKHFYYPKSAQRKNWQGLVILSFTILPTGDIDLIQINKSSGYSLLDNAAINALVQIKRNKDLSIALNGNTLNHLLPVNYKLTY